MSSCKVCYNESRRTPRLNQNRVNVVIPSESVLAQAKCHGTKGEMFQPDHALVAKYCNECPIKQACHDLVEPKNSGFTGVCAGKVYIEGHIKTLKQCRTCGITPDKAEFHKRSTNYCRACFLAARCKTQMNRLLAEVEANARQCKECEVSKPMTDFRIDKVVKGKEYRLRTCRLCMNDKRNRKWNEAVMASKT